MEKPIVIKDCDSNYVEVTDDCSILMTGINDLVATLLHCGAIDDNRLKVKDIKTGHKFEITYLGKDLNLN